MLLIIQESDRVLIDTWWNVNTSCATLSANQSFSFNRYMVECELSCDGSAIPVSRVLIDTWWNVNIDVPVVVLTTYSFNRYMVECEFIHQLLFKIFKFVLIDTWWNVNVYLIVSCIYNKSF